MSDVVDTVKELWPIASAISIPLTIWAIQHAVGARASFRSSKQEIYAEAIKAALAWQEALYRVRRRDRGDGNEASETRRLVDHFHKLQESITYYEAWMGAVSPKMRQHYRSMVEEVKAQTRELIRSAWEEDVSESGRQPWGDQVETDEHPKIDNAVEDFLEQVRRDLSWRKCVSKPRQMKDTK